MAPGPDNRPASPVIPYAVGFDERPAGRLLAGLLGWYFVLVGSFYLATTAARILGNAPPFSKSLSEDNLLEIVEIACPMTSALFGLAGGLLLLTRVRAGLLILSVYVLSLPITSIALSIYGALVNQSYWSMLRSNPWLMTTFFLNQTSTLVYSAFLFGLVRLVRREWDKVRPRPGDGPP